jgi:hypothetical protein
MMMMKPGPWVFIAYSVFGFVLAQYLAAEIGQ